LRCAAFIALKLIVAKLDRLARNVGFLTTLMNDGVEFTCCDMPQANKLTIHILAAVAGLTGMCRRLEGSLQTCRTGRKAMDARKTRSKSWIRTVRK
jgi:DNA invertase Pin-like site-specific DNA recombinase